MPKTAIAVIAKTLELTPAKTRLAAGCGRKFADEFYQRSMGCLSGWKDLLLNRDSSVSFFVAVAEDVEKARPFWPGEKLISQGSGDLAERLNFVYQYLLKNADAAVLIGVDSPQIDLGIWEKALNDQAAGYDFVVGPASDGGFYFFMGSKPLTADFWRGLPYSAANTFDCLIDALSQEGRIALLPVLTDVDVKEDIPFVIKELRQISHPTFEQRELVGWLLEQGYDVHC